MSYSTVQLHKYERRKRWLTYCLEFYIALIFCIQFFVPFLIKLFDAISMHKTFWQFDASYFRIFSQQQSAMIENTASIWPIISNIFTVMYIDAFIMLILGVFLSYQYITYRNNRRLLVYEVMIVIVCIQLIGAILGVAPFIALKTIAYAAGLLAGHYFSDPLVWFTNPMKPKFTLKSFFYIEVDEKKKEKSS